MKEYPTSVHLTRPLRAKLRAAAKHERRSVSSQIRFILDQWLQANYPHLEQFLPPVNPLGGPIPTLSKHDLDPAPDVIEPSPSANGDDA